ncbi:winged helix-turn-helix transcriptional regulator [Fulvivirga lutea]|uniref:Helix-turn-helix transcriptional regulator n=1 Tax=Fulvivirga lutea TaxID=2810512 RepID=A0A974WEH5_9BACT|nr:helix-turn-helix domain-containing protein [Fulvivirga lutea]QSE96345.1 helix-turn-helix transcriptional regulator [Fulvivirga lutea]
MKQDCNDLSKCPVTATMSLIGGKWKPIIIYAIGDKKRRFGEISARIPGLSRKVLTEQLKQLEKDNLINRKQFNEIPPRVEYELTGLGKSLGQILHSMAEWGKEHVLATTNA